MTNGGDDDPDPIEWKPWWSWALVTAIVVLFWIFIAVIVKALRS